MHFLSFKTVMLYMIRFQKLCRCIYTTSAVRLCRCTQPHSIITGNGRNIPNSCVNILTAYMRILVGHVTRSISQPRKSLLVQQLYSKELQANGTQHRITYLYEVHVHVDNLESQTLLFCRLQASTGEIHCVQSHTLRAISGRVSEPRDVGSDFSFVEKESVLQRGLLVSGDLPLSHTHVLIQS